MWLLWQEDLGALQRRANVFGRINPAAYQLSLGRVDQAYEELASKFKPVFFR